VDNLLRSLSDSTDRIGLVFLPINALVAWCVSFNNWKTGHFISIGTSFQKGNVKTEANLVDVFPSFFIIESVDDEIERGEEFEVKLRILYPAHMGLNLHLLVLSLYLLF
jgi:hypothetical protein